jgi:phosphoribosylamine---glycine ligase
VRVLVVGSGGREHSLAWGLARSPLVDELVAAPGNPGMEALGECTAVDVENPIAIANVADAVDADLTVVGPEVPLVAGAVDAIEERGRTAFGPRAAAARLEGSKAWMKDVLVAAGVPTARYASFSVGDADAALVFLESLPGFYVVKTDGLAAGKGVVVTDSLAEARDAVRSYLSGEAFGDAGRTLVIEEGLTGPELSLLVLCSGGEVSPLAPAQDFKRIGDGDAGPNTGGMGAYSPVPAASDTIVGTVLERAVMPTLLELRRRDVDYRGVLYAGLMLTADGVKVLEYNVRFGDPECQVVVPRLETDLARHCLEVSEGSVSPARFGRDACVTVVLATEGYPASTRTGDVIIGLDAAARVPGVEIFHAATARDGADLLTAGGRVLDVTATAPSLGEARARAYEAVGHISWPGMQYRTDIAGEAATGGDVPSKR